MQVHESEEASQACQQKVLACVYAPWVLVHVLGGQ